MEWSPDFGSDSITLTEKDLVQEVTIGSEEIPHSAWSLLLSQRFLEQARIQSSNYSQLARDYGYDGRSAIKCRNTSEYQVSDLGDVEL